RARGDAVRDRMLEAGRRAPSSRNWQPWDFVVVTDRQRLADLARVWRSAGHVARSAATVALVARTPTDQQLRDWLHYDLGQATISMMLTAADLGIGSGHARVAGQHLARPILGLPPGRPRPCRIAVGDPAGRPLRPIARPTRRPFSEVVHRGRW